MIYAAEASTGVSLLSELFTLITGWMTSIASVITGNILFMIPLGIFLVGAAVGLAYRLIRG